VRVDLPVEVLPDVFLVGYASRHTFGATSWLVRRPEGNVLVDVPRPVKPLLDRIEALGGVRRLFLTHRDDVHGHDAIVARFGATRVVHRADAVPGAEVVLDGDAEVDGLRVIATPGHTRGSACLLFRDVLFMGDHLWGHTPRGWSDGGAVDGLHAGRSVAWFSWEEQLRSLAKLLDVPFAHVLPGHGRPWHGTVAGKDAALRALLSRAGASARAASPPAAAGG
jgi:glyoxylase-like metal-dependent hydrolase (beta-lactamase superfamily II)